MRKAIVIIILVVAMILPFAAFNVLPVIGDPNSAPNTHVTDYYIEHAQDECNSPNMVTAVIVDYRAYDTMFETTVMFLAGIVVVLLLSAKPKDENRVLIPRLDEDKPKGTGHPIFENINKRIIISITEAVILIYAIYVLFHGEVSLGGGFQAGALIGMAYLLDVMVVPGGKQLFYLPKDKSAALAGVGPFIYALTGILSMIGGGLFLEYKKLPFPVDELELHSIGILLVEIGVTIGVMATIITILNALMEKVRFDDEH